MHRLFPTTYSTLSVNALLAEVISGYELEAPIGCEFIHRGLNDTYLILTTQPDRYILRVYRSGWRSLSEILYELEALIYLNEKHIPVSIPLARKDNSFVQALAAPEGERYTVLFTYAPGNELSPEETDHAFLYGQVTARVHAATDEFVSAHERFRLDLNHLLEASLSAIQPRLGHRSQDWDYLQRLGDKLRNRLAAFPSDQLDQGFCHGDLHLWNAKITGDKKITLFDFDCCGVGWRAYDVAVFRWSARLGQKEAEYWEAFLRGYQTERLMNEVDLQIVPLFIGIRHIWLLGLHTGNGHDWGYGWMNDRYFDRAMKFLKEWEADYFSPVN